MAKHFKITNTTIKPKRLDPTTGADLRRVHERVGHGVSYRDDSNNSITLPPDGKPRFLSKRNPGIDRLAAEGLISVEEVDDITTSMRAHVMSGAVAGASAAATTTTTTTAATTDTTTTAAAAVRAVEMGESSEDALAAAANEYEGARNPDGEPNFVVKAKNTKKKEPTQAASAV